MAKIDLFLLVPQTSMVKDQDKGKQDNGVK